MWTAEALGVVIVNKPKKKLPEPANVAGILLFALSGIFMSLALFFASQTVLAPFLLNLFVSNALFAHFINHEAFDWRVDGVVTFFVGLGMSLCAAFAPKETHNLTDSEMVELYKSISFVIFSAVVGSFIFIMWLAKRSLREMQKVDALLDGGSFKSSLLHMSYGALAGALGGVNVTLTKSTFTLMVGQFNDGGVLGVLASPLIWCISFTLVFTYVLQLKSMADGLEKISAVVVLSTQCVTEEVVVSLGGLLYFQDYKQMDPKQWSFFLTGNFVAVISVIILTHFKLRREDERKNSGDDRIPIAPGTKPQRREDSYSLIIADAEQEQLILTSEPNTPDSQG